MAGEQRSASAPLWRLSSLWNRASFYEDEEAGSHTWPNQTLASQSMHSFSTFHTTATLSAAALAFPDPIHKRIDDDWSSHHDSLFDQYDEDASEYFDEKDDFERRSAITHHTESLPPPTDSVLDLAPMLRLETPRGATLLTPADRSSWFHRFSAEGFSRPLSEAFFKEQLRCVSATISNLATFESVRPSNDIPRPLRSNRVSRSAATDQQRTVRFEPPHRGLPNEESSDSLVSWSGSNDPENPMNWSRKRKWWITIILGLITFCVTFASSVLSPGIVPASREFGVSEETFVLTTSLFVLGFALGPLCWGPLSEIYGRRRPLFLGLAGFAIAQIPVGAAPNLATVLVCRLLQGLFGCAPLAIIGGTFADFWAPLDRGIAVSLFSAATFMGPTMGPILGGYLTQYGGWRYTAWLNLTLTLTIGSVGFFVCPETYGPVLLQRRARKLRYTSRNWAIHALADEQEIDMRAILSKYITRPFCMLYYEPILLMMTLYTAFIYGILYGFFETYPLSFNVERGWTLGESGLPFLAILGGVIAAGLVNWAFSVTRYARIQREKGRVPPEERLLPMIVGALILPVGLMWFAWTSTPTSNPTAQILAGVPTGMGIVLIFLQGINYIVDTYMMLSASAIAGNIFVRSLVGFAFPLFATPMFRALGLVWANTVLAFVAIVLIPVPMFFYLYGARIRKISRFAPKMMPGGRPGPPMQTAAGGRPLAFAAVPYETSTEKPSVAPPRPPPSPPITLPITVSPASEADKTTIGMAITTASPEPAIEPLPEIPSVASPIKCSA